MSVSGDRVMLRTAAPTQAAAVLANAGAEVAATGPGMLTIAGLSAERAVVLLSGHAESAVAIGAVLGLLYLIPVVAFAAGNATLSHHPQQIGPMTAGMEIQATTGLNTLPISPWAGLGVLAAWTAGALLLGGLLLRMRDA